MLHKSVYVSAVLQNIDTENLHKVLNIYQNFTLYCKDVKDKFQNIERITDYDPIPKDALAVFTVKLLVNAVQKFRSVN